VLTRASAPGFRFRPAEDDSYRRRLAMTLNERKVLAWSKSAKVPGIVVDAREINLGLCRKHCTSHPGFGGLDSEVAERVVVAGQDRAVIDLLGCQVVLTGALRTEADVAAELRSWPRRTGPRRKTQCPR